MKEKINEGIVKLCEVNPIVNRIFKLDMPYQDKLEACVFELVKENMLVSKRFETFVMENPPTVFFSNSQLKIKPLAKALADKLYAELKKINK